MVTMTDYVRLWFRLVPAYAAGYFLSYGLRSVNAVIAPELMQELNISAAGLGLLTSAYFLGFGLFQLPLGLLLDRFGPRRVEAALLLVAASGCTLFALGTHLQALALGRALIGLGVSACLMASFKAFSQWFPIDRLPALTATIMVAGGLGALSASVPVEAALPLLGWRGVFFGGGAAGTGLRFFDDDAGPSRRSTPGVVWPAGPHAGQHLQQPPLLAFCAPGLCDGGWLHGDPGFVGGSLADGRSWRHAQ